MISLVLAAQAAQGGGGFGGMIFMLVAIFVIMYFFMVRPQQKRQKKIREFQNSLQEGSRVVTGGGIYGTVRRIDQAKNTIDVEVAHGVVITVDKGSVFQDTTQRQTNA
ncbi:preprotein translocase subunit YajC [Hallella multisaccharivorax DSM 17128]|uniref:Sec translocon accessory complex subunit YajC n=1 Tax=Hallella multisaccharivorax DSM 17128 TaxID=688246 RepID=F8NBI6_9BACT|nr:preprotein translocase subunit YajC [Hallella multisaccharivorax]EGN57948.1 protein translocase subunit yajC [Hallella multisaccharivorax DSM 17128]GJG30771.1 preprotein translocase subunit YajC [Hallella multisaccharivorax DSM 17128]